jgi:hypothetical protein
LIHINPEALFVSFYVDNVNTLLLIKYIADEARLRYNSFNDCRRRKIPALLNRRKDNIEQRYS